MNKEIIDNLFKAQLAEWETARINYDALPQTQIIEFKIDNCIYRVQFNPSRIVSSTAKIDNKSISERKCFLCKTNRPTQQKGIVFNGHYDVLVNPFPIFPKHLTIADRNHSPQLINERFGDMLDLAKELENYIIFYNGPKCGASAPDHAHFQAGNKGFLPIESNWRFNTSDKIQIHGNACMYFIDRLPGREIVIEADDKTDSISIFETIYNSMEINPKEEEPMMNILSWCEDEKWITIIFPRKKHRPDCYTAEGENNLVISPASVDLGGVFITPLEKDFNKISAIDILSILNEVCITADDFTKLKNKIRNYYERA